MLLVEASFLFSVNDEQSKGEQRLRFLGQTVVNPIAATVDTLIGVTLAVPALIGEIVSVASLGQLKSPLSKWTMRELSGTEQTLPKIVGLLLNVMRPDCIDMRPREQGEQFNNSSYMIKKLVRPEESKGIIKRLLSKPLEEKVRKWGDSNNFLLKHICTRALGYPLLLIANIVARVADTVIAACVVPTALLTGGYFDTLNHLAYHSASGPLGLIPDLFYSVSKMINPQAELLESSDL